jgi:hypothetical protein
VLELGLPLIPIAVRGEAMIQRLSGSGTGSGDGADMAWGAVNGRLDLLPLPLIGAYVTAGGGLYSSRFPSGTTTPTSRSTDPGINVGVGAELNLFVLRSFVEVRYHRVMTDPARAFIPVTVGLYF